MDSIDVEEKKKMFEIMKDRELGGNMDWMYRGDKPDSEEFLLGKSIDKLVSEATTNEGSGSIFSERIKANVAMDMAAKMREDPLFAIRKKEEEARRHLLSNPVKMKQLEKLVEQQRQMKLKAAKKKEKKKKKKKSKDSGSGSGSSSDDSEDELVNQYLSILTQKKGSQSDSKHKPSVEAHQRGKKNNDSKPIERDPEERLVNHRHVEKNDFKGRDIRVSRNSRDRRDSSDRGTEDRKSKKQRSYSPDHMQNQRGKDSRGGRKKSSPSATNRHTNSESSPDVTSRPRRQNSSDEGETKRVYGLIKTDRHHSTKSNEEMTSSKSKKSRESSSSSSRSPAQSSHKKDKKHKKRSLRQKSSRHKSSSKSRSRSPIRKRSITPQKNNDSRSKSPTKWKNSALPKKKLSTEEKARKVQEMMENAKWRDEQRKFNVERYRKEEDRESSRLKTYQGEAGFLNSMMSQHASNSSVEDRLKRNKYNIQRTRAALDKNFTQH